jgi:hypothetical protein
MSNVYENFVNKIRSWGGNVIHLNEDEFEDVHNDVYFFLAPFCDDNLGINWKNKIIYFEGKENIPNMIHEAGHLFASKDNPNESDEWSFFGWEYKLAQELKIIDEWDAANFGYQVDLEESTGSVPWSSLTQAERAKVIGNRLVEAKKIGLIVNGKAVNIR